ncbi:DUF2798 domain-containing protein [Secundilactobacillus collinoides]|uniref:Integral membrane protein n=2 Tax=Secundilactobacillus collinoides TaxID=33960 RepID=A0A0R2B9F1_SECCO|nr:DUF2798 domain-containing protein [Secundilactobacillus collinoides]KRM75170.1 hypothetical protein FC82_GL002564 [Secundilactobacillus collinoides DSM 20515 = JCM 1123]KZL43232.1 membrane protein [Secundilactobacillus collinoides]
MPRNLKEELLFTAMMAGLMVFGMVAYNVALAQGFAGTYMLDVLAEYPGGLAVAVVLDLLLVGPIAKKLAFRYIINDYMKRHTFLIGITISVMMVLGMVSCMSLFGLIMAHNFAGNIWINYLHTWGFNVIVALPLQLAIVGPIARTVLGKVQGGSDARQAEVKNPTEQID